MSRNWVYEYREVTDEDIATFNRHKDRINEKVREKFPSIPVNFELKPVRYRCVPACGKVEDFQVAVPDNKFIRLQLAVGGYQRYKPDGQPIEDTAGVYVMDDLLSTLDE
ncbi:hypothetical protein I4U23_005365 [Adineta vaga]|nr:hypothetical protein I4U23_005365 [Adineta vaga]